MRGDEGFIRAGLEDVVEVEKLLTKIDNYSIVDYYRILKNGESPQFLPPLLDDLDELELETIECLEVIINSVLTQIVKLNRPFTEFKDSPGRLKALHFLAQDPVLKQAVGKVTQRIFMRKRSNTSEIALNKTKKVLGKVREAFLEFLLELIVDILPQINQIMKAHRIDEEELLRMGGPMIESITASKISSDLFRSIEVEERYIIQLGFDGYDSELKNPRDKMFE